MSLDDATNYYHTQAWSPVSAAFFEKRGLVHSTVDRFRLGYAGQPFSVDERRRRGCLVLPYEDGRGRVRQLRYRPIAYEGDAKYLSVAGEHSHLFAVRAAENPKVYICEGEIDAMSLWQVGLKAVGIPGVRTWRAEWRWLFRNCERVVLVLDPDPAGLRATSEIYRGLSQVTDVDVAALPAGMDVNDVLVRLGAETLREVVG